MRRMTNPSMDTKYQSVEETEENSDIAPANEQCTWKHDMTLMNKLNYINARFDASIEQSELPNLS